MDGALRTYCHRVVDLIVMEVEYIKNHTACHESEMKELLETLGFSVQWDGRTYSNKTRVSQLPAEVTFVQQFTNIVPAQRLAGWADNPCADVEPL